MHITDIHMAEMLNGTNLANGFWQHCTNLSGRLTSGHSDQALSKI